MLIEFADPIQRDPHTLWLKSYREPLIIEVIEHSGFCMDETGWGSYVVLPRPPGPFVEVGRKPMDPVVKAVEDYHKRLGIL